MKRPPLLVFLTVALIGCSQSVTQRVGEHTFLVPKNQLMANQLYWVPFKSNGFSFILNPKSELPEQMLVGLDPVQDACPRGFTTGDNPDAPFAAEETLSSHRKTLYPRTACKNRWATWEMRYGPTVFTARTEAVPSSLARPGHQGIQGVACASH
jgi:hypothetical protein